MSQRGVELISELRYLWPSHVGQFDAEFLPNDKGTSENRYLVGWDHQSLLWRGWRATVDAQTVSDTRYFEDLSASLSATSQTHLEHAVALEYYDSIWSVMARFQDFETLDEALTGTDKPYRREPQITVNAALPDRLTVFDLAFDGELSLFDRNVGVTGSRLFLSPSLATPLEYRGLRIEPAVALTYTTYNLDDQAAGEPDDPSRTTPIYSVDMSSVFERGTRGNRGWLQTLEPRVQYVHIPFSEQDDLPVFDTIEPDFNMVQLFRRNRYVGYDRIGDTDQLNIGLTTRLLDAESGAQFLSATVGETRFFSAQDVTLPGAQPVDTDCVGLAGGAVAVCEEATGRSTSAISGMRKRARRSAPTRDCSTGATDAISPTSPGATGARTSMKSTSPPPGR